MSDAAPRRYLPPLAASRIQFRGGRVLMCRRGALNAMDQHVGRYAHRAPERRGIWAFPWPHYDEFFAHHKFDEVLPKHLTRDAITAVAESGAAAGPLWDERERWIRANSKVQPIRKFWWEGQVYARFDARGRIDEQAWNLLPGQTYATVARKVEPGHGNWWSADHMEVFLSERHGRVVGRAE